MKKRTYNAPVLEQEQVVLEAGIAVSETIIPDPAIETGVAPEAWKEGNTDWW